MLVHADLHIHSPFSIGTSPHLDPVSLQGACVRKGIQVLGSGDALHPEWRKACQDFGEQEGFVLLPTTEVEDAHRIHHLILMEDFSACRELARALGLWSRDISTSGRPHVAASGEIIAREVHHLGGRIGPAHAFTPWTSLYAHVDHLQECYGDEPVDFLELGLSADSSYAAGIPELAGIPFLSNSDAHSADMVKVGREWNQIEVSDLSPHAVMESIAKGKVLYNAGLFPELGKYHRTACSRCYCQYTAEEFVAYRGRCPKDGGRIKKGVCDRVLELSRDPGDPRPPYYHRVPLEEIIRQVLGTASHRTRGCRALYDRLLSSLGTEICILMDTPVSGIQAHHEGIAEAIRLLRIGDIQIQPGGGGRYGTVFLKSKHYGMYPTTDHNA